MADSVPTFKYGYVVGRFINSKGDSEDLDRLPDYVGAKLKPTFTRVRGQYVQPLDEPEFGIHGAMVYHEPVVAGVTDQGFLTGDVDPNGNPLPDATPGVWLVVGRYRVSLGSQFPSMEIEVLESHTEDAPLDLSTEQKYVPPPGVVVNTLPLPKGGEPGQVYGWTGSSVGWYTPEEGPSAYEVALSNGFSGTVDEWLASLKGAKGDPAEPVATAPRVVQLVTDGWMLGAAEGEDVPLGTLGQITNTSFVNSGALLIRSSTSRYSSWSILRGHVKMIRSWTKRSSYSYPEVGIISIRAVQSEARVINFRCSIMSTDTVNWDWSMFVPDDMGDANGTFFNRWSDALGIEPTTDYTHPETGEVGTLYPLEAREADVPDYGGSYYDDDLLADALTFDADRIRLVRTAK